MINIKISKTIKEKCEGVAIGSIEAFVKVEEGSEKLWEVIDKRCKEIEGNIKFEDVLKLEEIESSRKGYKSFGKDPSRYRLSSESLVKRIVKGNGLYKVNNVVDINNLISLQSYFSVGSYDLDKIDGEIIFTLGEEGETYEGIGRGEINLTNLPLFKDSKGNFGSTTSDSTRAMITEDTKHIIMNVISFGGKEKLSKYLTYAGELLEEFAEGKIIETKIIE